MTNKVIMQQTCGDLTGCCFQRCVGMNAANAAFSVTYECDQAHGTRYHQRFIDHWTYVQRQDLVVDGAMTDFPYELARLATDIAGGLLGTMPSAQDLEDPVAGPYIRKYLAAAGGVDTLDRMKVLRLIDNMVAGPGAVAYLIESMHGAGSPMAQRIMIARQGDLDAKIELAKQLLDIR